VSEESVETIAARHAVPVDRGRMMAEFTSIGVGGPVDFVLRPSSVDALAGIIPALRAAGFRPRVIGGGANLIAGEGPFREPVILTRGIKHGPIIEGHRARAGCGLSVKKLVTQCVEKGLTGLEFAEGIPGTVGGTVFMNAGSYGGQMADVVREVLLVDAAGHLVTRKVGPTDFSYRRSPFTSAETIVEAVFDLAPGDPQTMRETLRSIASRRLASQPPGERSAGCVFKNPKGDSAGRIVDAAGLKGLAVGGASVSTVHGNFIVNRGDATSTDVLELIAQVKSRVAAATGVALEEEVILWTGDPS